MVSRITTLGTEELKTFASWVTTQKFGGVMVVCFPKLQGAPELGAEDFTVV